MKISSVIKLFAFFALICFVMVSASFALPVGTITYIAGRVDVLKAGQHVAKPLSFGEDIDVGDVIRAKSNGKAEITFINKNVLMVAPRTRVEIKQYMVQEDQCTGIMRLYRGKVLIISAVDFVKKIAAYPSLYKFEVHTTNSIAGIRGSSMLVFYERGVTGVLFLTGKGYAYNPRVPDIVIPVAAGEITFIQKDDGPPLPPGPASSAETASYVQAVTPTEQLEGVNSATEEVVSSTQAKNGTTSQGVNAQASSQSKKDKVADSDTSSDDKKQSKVNGSDKQSHGKSKWVSVTTITHENIHNVQLSGDGPGKKDIPSTSSSTSTYSDPAHTTSSTAAPTLSAPASTAIGSSASSIATITGITSANSINTNIQTQGVGVGVGKIDIQSTGKLSPHDQQPKEKGRPRVK